MRKPFSSPVLWLFLTVIGLSVPYVIDSLGSFITSPEEAVRRFGGKLAEKRVKVNEELQELGEVLDKGGPSQAFQVDEWRNTIDASGSALFGYRNDSLLFWSDNTVPVDRKLDPSSFHSRIVRFSNGWYEVVSRKKGKYDLFGLILIKHGFAYENQYLKNTFPPAFDIPSSVRVGFTDNENAYPVEVGWDEPLFYLIFPEDRESSDLREWVTIILNVVGILGFLLFLFTVEPLLARKTGPFLAFVILLGGTILIRSFTLVNHFPGIWRNSELFDPALYAASNWFPTLGDLLINGSLILFFSLLFHARLSIWEGNGKRLKWLFFFGAMLSLVYGSWVSGMIRGLVENSNIYFDLNDLFELSGYTILGMLGVAFLLASLFFFVDAMVKGFLKANGAKRWTAWILSSGGLVYGFLGPLLLSQGWIAAVFPVILLLFVLLIHSFYGGDYGFPQVVTILALMAIFCSFVLSKYSMKKEEQNRVVIAENLASDEDPVTDLQFSSLEDELPTEPLVYEVLNREEAVADLDKVLDRSYFRGYWDKYTVNVHLFGRDSSLVARTDDITSRGWAELEDMIKEKGTPTDLSDHLYYIHQAREEVSYIARIPLVPGEQNLPVGWLVVELISKQIPQEVGFPELLLEKSTARLSSLHDYSYARYVDGRLVDRSGEYAYRTDPKTYAIEGEGKRFLQKGGYDHLVYRVGEGTLIILSKPREKWVAKATTFSYLFVFFSLLLLASVLVKDLSGGFERWQLSLKSKVQALMVGITVASVLLFALVTQYYLRQQFQTKNTDQISEKTHSVLIEVKQKLGGNEELGRDLQDYMRYILSKISNVFFSDVNLYDPSGSLLATSRPKLFEEGLIGRMMHPDAYEELAHIGRSEYIQEERIGGMRYLSSYVPFHNDEGKVLGYLNLPYFAKQNELENELSTFFVAIINIFVLLFALSLVSALFISNWVTRPLKRLQESLSKVELGRSNEQLVYKGSDEVAELVREYNEKVKELQEKAEALARSERESAWREMAKQVAHEIKNPLTPMKLRLQQLQRSKEGMDPDRVKELTDQLIEQIDALSHIASEFSDFAKMPGAREEVVDLVPLLEGLMDLYLDPSKVNMHWELAIEKADVLADKEQLSRVFSNLISNAIQAIPEEKQGNVWVGVSSRDGNWIVTVKDDGVGIPDAIRERIFQPNFTTRTKGTGLGLAIARNIVEMNNGHIKVESEEGKGTTFKVFLPKASSG